MTKKRLRVIQKISRQAHMLEVLELNARDRMLVTRVDSRIRKREQNR